jgi:hypothetical protein
MKGIFCAMMGISGWGRGGGAIGAYMRLYVTGESVGIPVKTALPVFHRVAECRHFENPAHDTTSGV